MKKYFLVLFLFLSSCVFAQSFTDYFENATLRLDIQFCGNDHQQGIYLVQKYRQEGWAGRQSHLTEEILRGNGQLRMFDHETGQLLYVHTFSSLFLEWQTTEEAKRIDKSFQQSFNLPFPKQETDVEITLIDTYGKVSSRMRFCFVPTDILIRPISENGIPYRYLVKNGTSAECVDLAIVAEGYTNDETDKFWKDANRAVEALFTHEPFTRLKHKFNVVAVASTSEQSGPSIPHDNIWTRTALMSAFDTFYTPRYHTLSRDYLLYDILSGILFEHIIVLVNTKEYGGGGIYNQWMTCAADHSTFAKVLVHEFGHSYAGLGDEYDYGDEMGERYHSQVEPWEPNITTMADFSSKWQDMMGQNGVSLFDGGGYQTKGVWRPCETCRMKENNVTNFCPVCTRAIEKMTNFYTSK